MSSDNYIEITEKEVIDEYYNQLSIPLTDFLSDLKEKMNRNGYNILNNTNKETNSGFLELILYNIQLEQLARYKNKNVY